MYHLPILRTVNLNGRQYGRQFVPVDTKTVSHKLLVLLVMICEWCRHQDSNSGPDDYKSTALPTELYRQ